jgi:hypothetical protein
MPRRPRASSLLALALALSLAPAPARAALSVQICGASAPGERWTLTAAGQLVSATSGLCATAAVQPPVPEGTALATQACGAPGAPEQTFASLPNNTIVLAVQPEMCVNVKAYGKAPGSTVWLADCDTNGCEGNCDWVVGSGDDSAAAAAAAIENATLTNPASGLCLQDGSPLPPLPHTCEAGSPSARLPFCDAALDVDARVDDLLARMSSALKLQQWNIGTGGFLYDPALNLKAFHWDFTCSECARARARARAPAALTAASFCVAVAQRAAPAPRDPPPQSTASTTPTASRRRRR